MQESNVKVKCCGLVCCNVIIFIDATKKCRPYSISVADRLDSVAQQQEIWCQLLYCAAEKFSRQCERETLKMQNSLLRKYS